MRHGMAVWVGLLAGAAIAGCDEAPGGIPRTLVVFVAPPPRLIPQCRDSVRRAPAPQLVCSAVESNTEWFVRLDRTARVQALSRFSRVDRGRVTPMIDSARTLVQARLGDGEACEVGYGQVWHRGDWTFFVTAQGSDASPPGDTAVSVLVSAVRSRDATPC